MIHESGWQWRIWSLKGVEYYYNDPLLGRTFKGKKELVAESKKVFWFESNCRRDGEKEKIKIEAKNRNDGPYELDVYYYQTPEDEEETRWIHYINLNH